MSTSNTTYTVSAEFDSQEDADAFISLVSELGVEVRMARTSMTTHRRTWNTRLGRALLRSMAPNRTYDPEHFRIVCQEHEFSPSSWSPAIGILLDAGKVSKVGTGLYRLAQ